MTSQYHLGIKNYEPSFLSSSQDLINQHKNLLDKLKGKNIVEVYIVWSLEHNEEWMDSPVAIKLDDAQLELCANKLEEFSITINSFDLESEINWFGDSRFKWKIYKKYDDFKIIDVRIIELKNEISNVSDNPGFNNEWWSLGGIQLVGESNYLSIYNVLDSNSISQEINLGTGIRTKAMDDFR